MNYMKKRKAALVLAGGGARGVAHIGAIEELESQGFEISAVAGTSMGALVGGVYASGRLTEFKEWMCTLDKYKVFGLVDFTLSSEGLVKGDRVIKAMQELVPDVRIEQMPVPFAAVADRTDLNGLEKIREMIRLNQSDRDRQDMNIQSIPILKNPRVLAGMIDANRRVLTPYFYRLIEEGNRDGSIHTEYARELSELIPILTSLWLAPSVFPASAEQMLHKFRFIGEMLDRMGLPVIDEEILGLAESYFREFEAAEEKRAEE